jgi:hypothetical protein
MIIVYSMVHYENEIKRMSVNIDLKKVNKVSRINDMNNANLI